MLCHPVVLCFPIAILWKVKVTFRKKIVLAAIFGLVGFTIAVTIVRGSIFGGVYKSINATGGNEVNITWILFWFYVEFTVCKSMLLFSIKNFQLDMYPRVLTLCIVAFIVACVVSFRTLFVHKENQSAVKEEVRLRQESVDRRRQNFLERMRRLHDSVLDTCRTLEGPWEDSDVSLLRISKYHLPKPPSGRLSVDFSRDNGNSLTQKRSGDSEDQFLV